MPNWVTNRLTFVGENAREILASHLIKNEDGEYSFDFNSVEQMPKELDIEKNSRSSDGLKLYLAKINPLIPNLGCKEDKILPFTSYAGKILDMFGNDVQEHMNHYILKPSEIEELKVKYKEKFKDTIALGKQVYSNIEKYGSSDWYEWSYKHWGCKWNATNTFACEDGVTVYFDTPWGTPSEMMKTLAKMHPDISIKHDYAEEQIAFMCGHDEYANGELVEENTYDAYSKEAFEMYFDLWGCEDEFKFDPVKGTYVEKEVMEVE